jgi:hypothetical protein
MTEENYNKLLAMGYTERELKHLNASIYHEKSSLFLVNNKIEKHIFKTTNIYSDNILVSSYSKQIDKSTLNKELNEVSVNEVAATSNLEEDNHYWTLTMYGNITKDNNNNLF